MQAAGRHRAVRGRAIGVHARHVGRVGALAVALGVGFAVTTGAGLARADEGGESSSAGSTSNDSTWTGSATATPSQDTASSPTVPASGTSTSASTASDGPSRPTVPEMNVSTSGGAHTSGGPSATTAPTAAEPATTTTEPTADADTPAAPVKTTTKHSDSPPERPEAPATRPAVTQPDRTSETQSAPAEAPVTRTETVAEPVAEPVTPAVASTVDIAAPAAETVAPEAESSSVLEKVLTAAVAPLLLPGPASPVQSPLLWTVLAWSRRESESAGTADEQGSVAVTIANTPPTAVGDVYSQYQDTPLVVGPKAGLLSNDVDVDGDPFTLVGFGQPTNGSVKVGADGSFVYTPQAGFSGTDQFTYTIEDSYGDQSSATVLVYVIPIKNQPPEAIDDWVSTTPSTPVSFNPLDNDADPEIDPLQIVDYTKPGYGTLVQLKDGTFTYTPKTGFVGEDSFTYFVTDGTSKVSATVHITVAAANQPPVAKDDVITVKWGEQVIIDVLKNDTDPEGDELWISDYGTPANGSTGGFPGNRIEYTPDYEVATGEGTFTDTFTYTVTDSAGNTSTATVTVHMLPANRAPIAVDDSVTTGVNTSVTIDVFANDSDPDGDPLTVDSYGSPAHGTLTAVKGGVFVYTPDRGFTGVDSFDYLVMDPDGRWAHAWVNIAVKGTDGGSGEEPGGNAYTGGKDRPLVVSFANGVQAGTDYLGWHTGIEKEPQYGTLTMNADGSFTYTPQKGFVGRDTFVYYFNTSEVGDGPFTATIDVVDDGLGSGDVGTATAFATSSALGACWDNWMPWQRGPGGEYLTCLYPEAIRKEL